MADKIHPEAGRQLDSLIQRMIEQGVVCRVAPEPIYEHPGFEGRDVSGYTPEELHYDPSTVDKFLETYFQNFNLDRLSGEIASFSSNPSPCDLVAIVNQIHLGEGILSALRNLSDTSQRRYVASNDGEVEWPTLVAEKYTALRDNLSLQLSEAIRMGLEGVAEDLPEQRQERLARLMPMYRLGKDNQVTVPSEVESNLKYWDSITLLSQEKAGTFDEIFELPREPHYWSDARNAYIQSLVHN